MSPNEKNALIIRIERLKKELIFLDAHTPQTTSDLIQDEILIHAVERSLEIALESVLDIGRLIISIKQLQKPEQNSHIFDILAKAHIIPKKFADKIRGIGNLRNILVHDYTSIDYQKMFKSLKNIHDLALFVEYVTKSLKK